MRFKNVKAFVLVTLTFTSAMVLFSNSRTLSVFQSSDAQRRIELIIGVDDRDNVYGELVNLVERYNGEAVQRISTNNRLLGVVVSLPLTSALSSFFTEMKAAKLSRYLEPNEKIKMVQYEPNDAEWRNGTKGWFPLE